MWPATCYKSHSTATKKIIAKVHKVHLHISTAFKQDVRALIQTKQLVITAVSHYNTQPKHTKVISQQSHDLFTL